MTIWVKTRHVHTQTEIHFIAPAYGYTLNNYACALPPLANLDWSAFPEYYIFADNVNPWLMKCCQRRALILQWGPDTAPTVSTHLLGNIDPLWVHVDIIATLNSPICVILLFCFSLCHHPPLPTPLYMLAQCWCIPWKILKNCQKPAIIYSQVSCTKPIDNSAK